MPMDREEKCGRNADGSANREYCAFCFDNGTFRSPGMTLPQMVERVTAIMAEAMGMGRDAARSRALSFLPRLKRWSSQASR